MSKQPTSRFDADAAARRAEAPPIAQTTPAASDHSQSVAVRQISIDDIRPGDFQPRVVFEGIDDLAKSILATGLLQPIIVFETTPAADDTAPVRYALIDGHRRWLALRSLRANGQLSESTVAARVLTVNEEVAVAVSHIVNMERANFSAFEQARSYQRLRAALRASGQSASSRAISSYVNIDHKHSSIAAYVALAERVTDVVIADAGLRTDKGNPDYARVGSLSLAALRRVANAPPELRADVLRAECEPPQESLDAPMEGEASQLSFEDRVVEVAEHGRQGRRWRGRAADIPIDDARRLLSEDLLPAAVAVARRVATAVGGAAGLIELHESASIIVVPAHTESMTPETTAVLLAAVNELRQRLSRASRKRRK
ncbi:MAG TPA: ParB/RepB/Spo0J family partition protein [Gemmatimonadaceae bacterium]